MLVSLLTMFYFAIAWGSTNLNAACVQLTITTNHTTSFFSCFAVTSLKQQMEKYRCIIILPFILN